MILKRGTVHTIVRSATATERAWLTDQLTYSQGRGMGTERVCHLKEIPGKSGVYFNSGFIRFVIRAARAAKVNLTIEDARVRPEPVVSFSRDAVVLAKSKPWFYQWEGAEALVKAEHGVVELPTGSGKTLVAVILAAVFTGKRVLYAVSDAVLASKTAATMEAELGIKVGRDLLAGELVTCTTLQKLYAQLSKLGAQTRAALNGVQVFIVDEAHGVPATTFSKVCSACPAFYRFALSATPFDRSDKKSAPLLGLFGGLVYRKTEGELADPVRVHPNDRPRLTPGGAYLPRADIKMIRFEQAAIFLGKYPEAYVAQVVKSAARNDLIADIAAIARKPCLVLFNDIKHKHGVNLKRRIEMLGFSTEMVDADASEHRRKDVIDRLNAGSIDVVVASRVFNVGVDMPELRSVVIAGGMQSPVQSIQRVGRGMRVTKKKRSFEVWDVLDISVNFSKAKGAWIARHANERMKTYRSRGHNVCVGDSVNGPWETLQGILPAIKRAGKAQQQAEEAA